jgi:hypothetical protein
MKLIKTSLLISTAALLVACTVNTPEQQPTLSEPAHETSSPEIATELPSESAPDQNIEINDNAAVNDEEFSDMISTIEGLHQLDKNSFEINIGGQIDQLNDLNE